MRVAVVGGGPGGLFASTLLRRVDVTLFERNRADDTFGFGVVFSDATLAGIHEADPVLRTALTEHGVHWDPIEVRLHGERHRCGGNGMAAVERRALLGMLQQGAFDAGVELRFGSEAGVDALMRAGYDLVIAADGANSRLCERYADVFSPSVETASAKFIWLGTTYPFDGLTFVHERSPHGVFAVHGYPIGNGISTFIVETDPDSWLAAGLDEFDVAAPAGPSDEKSRAYLRDVFAGQLDGHDLLVNNSRWGNFRTRRAAGWRHRVGDTAVALLGDSAHTAHFSVGSGTKMAMEDAIALAGAVASHPDDVDVALSEYEQVRRPQVEKIQNSARPSLSWWEHFGRSHDTMPGWQFAYHFFTRSLTDAKVRKRDTGFVDASHTEWARGHGAEPLRSPFELNGLAAAGRIVTLTDAGVTVGDDVLAVRTGEAGTTDGPWALDVQAPSTEAELGPVLDRVDAAATGGAAAVVVREGTSLTRRLVCEHARLSRGLSTVLVEDADDDRAMTAVLSGRTDLVAPTAGATP